ncbi:MAG: hypothetical protein IJ668_10765 [Selenomonadaceae bacterium]|nr:hypothetical protein [Selenomonadaceae bacterium]
MTTQREEVKDFMQVLAAIDADSINNDESNVSLSTSGGDDTIVNSGSSVKVDADGGNDFVLNGQYFSRGGTRLTVDAGAGNDTIISHGSNSSLIGGVGDDSIANGFYYYEPWNVFYGDSPDGYELLSDFNGSNVYIDADSGNDSVSNRGENVTINAGAGNDFVLNGQYFIRGGTHLSVDAGAGNDTIISHGSNSSLIGGDGDDSIINGFYYHEPWDALYDNNPDGDASLSGFNGSNVYIDAGGGNDFIKNRGDNVTINAGSGSLTVDNTGSVLIVGAGSDEVISLGGEGSSTVMVGVGNSTVSANNKTVETFKYSGGNLFLKNYDFGDTIELVDTVIESVSTDGGNLIFMTDNGSVTLKNMTNHAITIKDADGNISTQVYGTGLLPRDVIRNYVQFAANSNLDGSSLVDAAIRASSHFNSLQDVINHMVSDCRTANDADTFLRDYCGIIYDNDDGGAVIGWDNGGLTSMNYSALMPASGDASYPSGDSFTIDGLTINNLPNQSTLSDIERWVIRGLYSWWTKEALDLIDQSYGLNFYRSSEDNYTIPFYFENDPTAFGWAWAGPSLTVNMAYTNFEKSDRTGGGLNGALVHEYTHVLQCKFDIWNGMTNYMTEGMANLTGGGDGYIEFAGNADSLAAYLDTDNSFSEDGNVYTVGYMFWRYYMKQSADAYDEGDGYDWTVEGALNGTTNDDEMTMNDPGVMLNAGAGDDSIMVYGSNSSINGGADDDLIMIDGGASGVTVRGGSGNDSVANYGSNVLINGGAGDDFIYDNGSNVTIRSGIGDDRISLEGSSAVIEYKLGDGDDTVYGYGSNATISLGGVGVDGSSVSGSDKILTVGSGTIRFVNAADTELNIIYDPAYQPIDDDTTTVEDDTTTVDDDTTTVEDDTTTVEDDTTTVEDDTTSVEDDTTTVEDDTTSVEDDTTTVDDDTTTVEDDTTSVEDDTTSVEDDTTTVDDGTTSIADDTTSAADDTTSVDGLSINGARTKLTISDPFIGTVDAADFSDKLKTMDASNDPNAVVLIGNALNNVLRAGSGGSTIDGGSGNDKLYGGDGRDVFVWTIGEGKDKVYNYGDGDIISVDGGAIDGANFKESGKTVVITVDKSKLTINNVRDQMVVVVNGDNTINRNAPLADGLTYNKSKTALTIGDPFEGVLDAVDFSSKLKTLDATACDNSIHIIGNGKANEIRAGSGGATLDGGLGNDKLYGGAGADEFDYFDGSGKDVIYDYDFDQDVIRILDGTIDGVATRGRDVVFEVGAGSLTVKNGLGHALTVFDAAGEAREYVFGASADGRNSAMKKART